MLHRGSTDGHYPRLPEALQQLQVVSLGSLDLTGLESLRNTVKSENSKIRYFLLGGEGV